MATKVVGSTVLDDGTHIDTFIEMGKLYACCDLWKHEISIDELPQYTDDPLEAYDIIITTHLNWPFMTNLRKEVWHDLQT